MGLDSISLNIFIFDVYNDIFSRILVIKYSTLSNMGNINVIIDNGNKIVPIWQKRLLLIISIIIVACIYTFVGYDNKIILVNSSIVAPIAWSWILRPIFIKLGAGYKQPK